MLKYFALFTMFCLSLAVAAYDVHFVPTLIVNVADQVQYVMPERGITVPRATQVERGQPFALETAVAIREPLKEPLKLLATVDMKRPDGSVKNYFKNKVFFEIPAGGKGVFFSRFAIRCEFEPEDKSGEYVWTLTLRDQNGEKQGTASLKLVDSIRDDRAMDKAEFSKFLMNYYRSPKPERLMAAVKYFFIHGEADVRDSKKKFDPRHILYGFSELFKLNPQFHDDLARATAGANEKHQLYYALVFAGLGKEVVMAQKELIDPQVQVQIGQFAGRDPLAFADVKTPVHLDMLWTEFFITGKFAPVKRLVNELRNRPGLSYKEAAAKVKSGQKLTPEEQREVLGHMLQISAAWAMMSNLRRDHQLLGFYLETVLRRKLYESDDVAGNLVGIIKKAKSTPGSKK